MKGYQKPLNVSARTHLLGRSQQDSNPPGDHRVKEEFLRNVSLGVMDERDLGGRHPGPDELGTDILIDVEPLRVRRRKVAENELSAALLVNDESAIAGQCARRRSHHHAPRRCARGNRGFEECR